MAAIGPVRASSVQEFLAQYGLTFQQFSNGLTQLLEEHRRQQASRTPPSLAGRVERLPSPSAAAAAGLQDPSSQPVRRLPGPKIPVEAEKHGSVLKSELANVQQILQADGLPTIIGKGCYGVLLGLDRWTAVKAIDIDEEAFQAEARMHELAHHRAPGSVPELFAIGPNFLVMERFEQDLLTASTEANNHFRLLLREKISITDQIVRRYLALAKIGIYPLDIKKKNFLIRHTPTGEPLAVFCDLGGCAHIDVGNVLLKLSGRELENGGCSVEGIIIELEKRFFECVRTYYESFITEFVPKEKKGAPSLPASGIFKLQMASFSETHQEHLAKSLRKLGFICNDEGWGPWWTHPQLTPQIIGNLESALGDRYNIVRGYRTGYFNLEDRAASEGPLQGLTSIDEALALDR